MGKIAHDRIVEKERLGGILVMSACLILAVRTARREAKLDPLLSNQQWDDEIGFALKAARRVLFQATSNHPELFRQLTVAVSDGVVEEDVPN